MKNKKDVEFKLARKDLEEMKKQLEESLKQIDKELDAFGKAIRAGLLNKFAIEASVEKLNKELGR